MKCCLRYEFDTYEELQKELPPIGSDIVTPAGRAKVLNQEILTQQLLVQNEDNRRVMIDSSEVLSVIRKGTGERSRPRDSSRRSSQESDRAKQPANDQNDNQNSSANNS